MKKKNWVKIIQTAGYNGARTVDKSINSAQLICPIFILSKSKVTQYCSTNFGVTFPDQISGAYTHEKAYNFLPEMENLIRLVFCGHVLVWYFVG